MKKEKKKSIIVNLYSDGAAVPNPGKGGFGVIMSYEDHKQEFHQGYSLTTNNRMELMGVIFGLEQLEKRCHVNVYCDSKYVVDSISKGWAENWRKNSWKKSDGTKAINSDLWERLLDLISNQQWVEFHWVRGHNGHVENERCDELAEMAINGENLLEDSEYLRFVEAEKEAEI